MSNTGQIRDPFREMIEAYALGALDPEERASVAAHLASGCEECSKALAQSQWLVSQLAYLAPEADPSDALRDRLLKTVGAEAAGSELRSSRAAKPAMPAWMWAAVAAVLLFAFYNAYEARMLQEKVQQTELALKEQLRLQKLAARELSLAHREAVILTDPHSVKIPMPAGRKDIPPMQATWHAALGIVVSGHGLPAPESNRTLQLWLIPKTAGAKPMPSLTLRPDADGKFDLLVPEPPDAQSRTKALAITEEPEGGSLQPTATPMWVGSVSGK